MRFTPLICKSSLFSKLPTFIYVLSLAITGCATAPTATSKDSSSMTQSSTPIEGIKPTQPSPSVLVTEDKPTDLPKVQLDEIDHEIELIRQVSEAGGGFPLGEAEPGVSNGFGFEGYIGIGKTLLAPSDPQWGENLSLRYRTFPYDRGDDSKGWKPNLQVTVEFVCKKGASTKQVKIADHEGTVSIENIPPSDFPPDECQLRFSANERIDSRDVTIMPSNTAHFPETIYDRYESYKKGEKSLFLFGFEPGDVVFLVRNKINGTVMKRESTQPIQINLSGNASIATTQLTCGSNDIYTIEGLKYGAIPTDFCKPANTLMHIEPSGPDLESGTLFEIAIHREKGSKSLLEQPSESSKVIATLSDYVVVRLINHTRSDNQLWLKVQTINGQDGWVLWKSAWPVRYGPIKLCASINFNSEIGCPLDQRDFSAPLASISASCKRLSDYVNANIRIVWYLEDKAVLTQNGFTGTMYCHAYIASSNTMPSGKYKVEVYIENFLAQQAQFVIQQ